MELPEIASLFHLADVADAETLPRFRAGGSVDNKLAAAFDPVTEADRAAERAIVAAIGARYPDHAVLGEEFGAQGNSEHLWVIDPIDGTRAFISGVPVWGTLIGYCQAGRARMGLMSQPFTGERYFADGEAAWCEHRGQRSRLGVRPTRRLDEATLFTTSPRMFSGEGLRRFEKLEAGAQLTRFGVDCYAYCMLAAGHADLVVESDLKPYDIVALVPIIEQAGGVVTTFDGGRPEAGGDIVAAATPELHAAALAILNG
ncbi:histidinol-phosphatase [Aurantimonas sp. C2-6-R+9]|uniref:histidinol-phosphatase n=1 Tax=unclassified Aurantimonas TaxID=2638230 RepID=UPI002E19DB08|nr:MULTISPECIES: histidinol-phosphatase [unclassified Aurantimonas]MEC5289346.1 histidinol-phosphatase [Aurantimonas sp. C2-3-R2]MEC5322941.1 histidinol-phosphatase [Aurantimonas sp. A3-2-R12]MEC5380790.1 histidinol-phosphatase [Aurantimonas sp. C2-6-R+9]MEC5410426.1 histidinol-phosphatase [Aurantimonas sp. C2-4-R8]